MDWILLAESMTFSLLLMTLICGLIAAACYWKYAAPAFFGLFFFAIFTAVFYSAIGGG